MTQTLRTAPPQPIFPADSIITWTIAHRTHRGRIVRHEYSAGHLFIVVAWTEGGPGRFMESDLPRGMSVGPPVSATERTQPMPRVQARGRT